MGGVSLLSSHALVLQADAIPLMKTVPEDIKAEADRITRFAQKVCSRLSYPPYLPPLHSRIPSPALR
jgi:hypothetical protein